LRSPHAARAPVVQFRPQADRPEEGCHARPAQFARRLLSLIDPQGIDDVHGVHFDGAAAVELDRVGVETL
jgi:hypothetical protein